MTCHSVLLSTMVLGVPLMLNAAYKVQTLTDHGVEVIRLTDTTADVEVSIAPSIGNRAYEMKVHGKNILYLGAADEGALKQRPGLSGIPFLAPWANRVADSGFWANDKKYTFNTTLGSMRPSPNGVYIHGMLSTSPLWEVTEVRADA